MIMLVAWRTWRTFEATLAEEAVFFALAGFWIAEL